MLILIFWGYVPGVVCYGVLVYDWRMWSFVHSYHCLQDQASLFVQRYNQLFFFFFFFLGNIDLWIVDALSTPRSGSPYLMLPSFLSNA